MFPPFPHCFPYFPPFPPIPPHFPPLPPFLNLTGNSIGHLRCDILDLAHPTGSTPKLGAEWTNLHWTPNTCFDPPPPPRKFTVLEFLVVKLTTVSGEWTKVLLSVRPTPRVEGGGGGWVGFRNSGSLGVWQHPPSRGGPPYAGSRVQCSFALSTHCRKSSACFRHNGCALAKVVEQFLILALVLLSSQTASELCLSIVHCPEPNSVPSTEIGLTLYSETSAPMCVGHASGWHVAPVVG